MKLPVVTAIPAKFSVFYDLNHVDLYTCLSTFWWKFLLLHRTNFCPEKKKQQKTSERLHLFESVIFLRAVIFVVWEFFPAMKGMLVYMSV